MDDNNPYQPAPDTEEAQASVYVNDTTPLDKEEVSNFTL